MSGSSVAEALDKSLADALRAEAVAISSDLVTALDGVSGVVRPARLLEAMRSGEDVSQTWRKEPKQERSGLTRGALPLTPLAAPQLARAHD